MLRIYPDDPDGYFIFFIIFRFLICRTTFLEKVGVREGRIFPPGGRGEWIKIASLSKPSLKYINIAPYSIALNNSSQPRALRTVHKCRMNMIETVLESSSMGNSENIYITGVISNYFLGNLENVIFLQN